ncbi:MAG: N-acetylneuraminate synthase family protein [Candidatus Omnitrophica bacterium]|nr:N-acetylneuraminate synthase family protein [Candidatus Omnitrophota bacterium]
MAPRTTIIAEIGENHVGDWDRARQMICAAAATGADIVKFQSYRSADVADDDPEKTWFGRVEVPDAVHRQLAQAARAAGVGFLSAPFTVERAQFLCEQMGLRAVKIASSELLNRRLLDYVSTQAETVYLSTGMATLDEVREAVTRLRAVPRVIIMHCVTQYPLKDEDANLRAIEALRQAFPEHSIGYSDHTIGITAPLIAVALGAAVIEKHFTMDKSLPGTDHALSVTPEELRAMVDGIRRVERLLGVAEKQPVAAELAIRDAVRARFPK